MRATKLMARFELTEIQAQAILDLRLARLTKLEVFKLEEELKELKKLIKKLTAISKSGELQLQVVKDEITEIKDKYPAPRHSRLVFTAEEADALLAHASEKQPGVKCTLVYTADERFKVSDGQSRRMRLQKPLEGKFKPQLVAACKLETVTDRRIFAFTNYGNCHKLDIYSPDFECKLSDAGVSLKDLSKDAVDGEKVVALFEIGERFPIGNLMFFTRKGMIKKSEWSEYDNQRKDSFLAVKLVEEDEVIAVEEESGGGGHDHYRHEERDLPQREEGRCAYTGQNRSGGPRDHAPRRGQCRVHVPDQRRGRDYHSHVGR